jgi:putative ABC transport system permease protein
LGANLLLVQPGSLRTGAVHLGAGSRLSLTEADATAIAREIPVIRAVAPSIARNVHIVRGHLNWATLVGGITLEYMIARDWGVERGRSFTIQEIDSAAKVVLLGSTVAGRLFPEEDALGQQVRIANSPFTVIGVLGEKGQNAASGRDQDDVAMIPLTAAKLRVLGSRSEASREAVDFILVKVAGAEAMGFAKDEITKLLRQRHRLATGGEDDFEVREPAATMHAQAAATRSLTFLLAAVASVSLVVGGISIMNIMLVSVTERTREIGLRQAVGARRRDVRNQFLTEAITLCLLGGLAGIVLGSLAALAIANLAGWPVHVSPIAAVVAVAFAGAVGVFFGFYPARKASRLDPIEALRYE